MCCKIDVVHLGRIKRIWYLSPVRAAKVQASLRIGAVSPEPPLLAHISSESRGTFEQRARSLAPLNGWACAVKICHDGMLEDTNSLDASHLMFWSFFNFVSCSIRIVTKPYELRHDKTNKMSVCPAKTPISCLRWVGMKKPWVLSYPLSAQRGLWLDWADAQADLSLCWAHSFCWFYHFVAHIVKNPSTCLPFDCDYWVDLHVVYFFIPLVIFNFGHKLG